MKSDKVNIFNRLTSSELADSDLFSDILENHYEKFNYLCSLIETINLNKIDNIYCNAKKNTLRVIIEPNNTDDINDIIYKINKKRDNYIFSKHFSLDVIESNATILIEISTINNKKEGELYDSRFI